MKSFSQSVDSGRRKYLCLDVAAISAAQLRAWCRFNGFDLSKSHKGREIKPHEFQFHVTLFYTESYHDTSTGSFRIEPFEIAPIGFEMLGKEKHIPVLLLDPSTPELVRLRGQYEAEGFKEEWETYKPHVSLSYARTGSTVGLDVPQFTLLVNRLNIKNVE